MLRDPGTGQHCAGQCGKQENGKQRGTDQRDRDVGIHDGCTDADLRITTMIESDGTADDSKSLRLTPNVTPRRPAASSRVRWSNFRDAMTSLSGADIQTLENVSGILTKVPHAKSIGLITQWILY